MSETRGDAPTGAPTRRRQVLPSRIRVFSSEANAPRTRRPADVLGAATAFAALIVLVGLARRGPGPVDQAATDLLQAIGPGLLEPVWELGLTLLAAWAVGLVGLAVISKGRLRVARDGLASAAIAAALVAIGAERVGTSIVDLPWAGTGDGTAFPALGPSLATATILAISPHLGRPLRRVDQIIIAYGALGAVAQGQARASGALAAVVIGVFSARLVLASFGSARGLPTRAEVVSALAELGVDVAEVLPAQSQPTGVYLVGAVDDEGPLQVSVCGRDERDAAFMAQTWRRLWYRAEDPTPTSSRLHRVEHEGFITLLAAANGLPAPTVVTAGQTRAGDALLVVRPIGTRFGEATALRTETAAALWPMLDALHDVGIVHGSLDGTHLGWTDDGAPCFTSLAGASTEATDFRVQADKAQLLHFLASRTTPSTAVQLALDHLGRDGLVELLPYLQTAVLPVAERRRDDAADTIAAVAGAVIEATDAPPTKLVAMRRVTWRSVISAGLLMVAGYAIVAGLSQLDMDEVVASLQGANWWLMAVMLVVSQTPRPLQAISTQGASPQPLPFGPLAALQLAISYINLAIPSTAARVAVNIRFFQKLGVDRTTAVTIGGLDSIGGFAAQLLILLTIGLTDSSSITTDALGIDIDLDHAFVWVLVAVVVLVGVVLVVAKRLRHWIVDQLKTITKVLRVLRSPVKVVQLLGGNLLSQLLFAAALALSCQAVGAELSLIDALMINTLVSLFAGLMPVPGGMGVTEAGLTAGLTAAGVPSEAAFAAVICYRMATFYLPPIWGAFALKWLERRDFL